MKNKNLSNVEIFVKNAIMKYQDILIFTDLDGSLLDHNNFEFKDIKDFVLKCLDKGIKIIPNSSKTKIEIESFFNELGKKLIFIRKSQRAFHPNATQFTLNLDKNIFSVWRQSRDRKQSICAITNVTSSKFILNTNMINLIDDEKWFDLLNPETNFQDNEQIQLKPYQTIWITNFKSE